MQKTRFSDAPCPVARSLDLVGEWWSILILRDAFQGLSRFDEFQQSLGMSPTLLARRLKDLVAHGILHKELYQTRPARYQYLLTERGNDFLPVLAALSQWGNRHLTDGDISAQLIDSRSDQPIEVQLINHDTQQPVPQRFITLAPGPAASDGIHQRAELMRRRRLENFPELTKETS
ncbi:transcriptional regulator [Serratia sp. YC16]|uniref:winged helix-turn-helix transcriptional regulator n=1 Tax=Serratia sp. YC16 TaxID=2675312 RepID=UPI0012BA0930|nr:helix-turn-helix domain-containing protein [Serratia sp. YC16]MTD07048.1 transcriptional regulator [Serratia sp. YC16]